MDGCIFVFRVSNTVASRRRKRAAPDVEGNELRVIHGWALTKAMACCKCGMARYFMGKDRTKSSAQVNSL